MVDGKADCLSCRIWGGIVHCGIAAFVGSHYKQMHSNSAKSFVIAFSAGKIQDFASQSWQVCPRSIFKPALALLVTSAALIWDRTSFYAFCPLR